MQSSLFTHCFFGNAFLISYSLQVYIVVDTVLYPYTLPIGYFSYPFSSLCLSCNLSQA